MPEYLAPGVYVEEASLRAAPIEGVSTSMGAFVTPDAHRPRGRRAGAAASAGRPP